MDRKRKETGSSPLPEATREHMIYNTVSVDGPKSSAGGAGENGIQNGGLGVDMQPMPGLSTVRPASQSPVKQQEKPAEGGIDVLMNGTDEKADEETLKDARSLTVEETRRRKALPFASLKTGLCYDVRMRFHATVAEDDAHPEDPRRIYRIYKELCLAGLVDDPQAVGHMKDDLMCRIDARAALPSEICLVHTLAHYNFILATRDMDIEEHKQLTDDGDSVFFNASSYLCAMLSAGGTIETCKAVVAGLVRNAFAVVRPPGHHAVPTEAQGFCLFNNVSVAARVCQNDFPEKCRKILIFDWDVHHGNGTQDAFYDDPNVLYMSIHVHQNGFFYPRGPNGDYNRCGRGAGVGMNVNVPWTDRGMGDEDYMLAFQKIIMPIATEFDPDLVIISAGFDAAAGDDLGGCFVTPACYAHMTHALMSLAKGKLAVCLEGGYDLDSISKSALAVTRTLMGEPPDRMELEKPSRLAEDDVLRVMRCQSKYWRCMQASDVDPASNDLRGERMHDIVRSYQSQILFDDHKMINLMILRKTLSKSFKDQVLATPNYLKAKAMLLIIHDPPDLMGISDPRTNKLDIHNTWLSDPLESYIQWAVDQDYAVIDINIPKHLTDLDELEPTLDGEDPPSVKATKDLIVYVWENYIQVNDATDIFLMGVGDAHYGIAHLLSNYDCSPELKGVVNFVGSSPLRSVRRDTDPYLGDWYYKNSLVFVSGVHSMWAEPKPPKRKFGRVLRSDQKTLSTMLFDHRETVTTWIRGRAEASAGGALGAAAAAPGSVATSSSLSVPRPELMESALSPEAAAAAAATAAAAARQQGNALPF